MRWTPSPVTIIYIYYVHRHFYTSSSGSIGIHGRVRVVVNCDKKIIKIKVAE